MSYKQMIETPLQINMILVSSALFKKDTVCCEIVITAIGDQGFLALDKEKKEHYFQSTEGYKCIGYTSSKKLT